MQIASWRQLNIVIVAKFVCEEQNMLNFAFFIYRRLLSTNDQYILSVFQLFKEFGYKSCYAFLVCLFFSLRTIETKYVNYLKLRVGIAS